MEIKSMRLYSWDSFSKHIVEVQEVVLDQLDARCECLQPVSESGVVFCDVVAHITIPLIIALFAFAFPFLFTVISHINNKYESENISKQFASELWYKLYLIGAAISAMYLITIGVMFLFINCSGYEPLMVLMLNWSSVIVAGAYSAVIVLFVHTCLVYNNPQRLIEKADKKLKRRSRRKSNNRYFLWLNSNVELCKYAVKKQNYNLFQSLVQRVSEESGSSEYEDNCRCLFYENVLESNLYGPQNKKIDDTLLLYWFLAFRQCKIPNLGIVSRMLAKVVSAVYKGNMDLLESYMVKAKSGYRYINDVPAVTYICGKDIDTQKKIEEERRRCWQELVEMHYLAIARLLSSGYKDVLRVLMFGDNLGYDRLFPGSCVETLRLYARCKENQYVDGSYMYWFEDAIIGQNPDNDLLEKFTALMLLLVPEGGLEVLHLISTSHMELIKSGIEKLVSFGKLWQQDKEFCLCCPQIVDIDIRTRIQKTIELFEKASISKLVSFELPEQIVHNLEEEFCNIFYANVGFVFGGVFSDDKTDKTELIEMGECTSRLYKLPFMSERELDISGYCQDEAQKFRSRYQYMFYSAISKMRITDMSMPVNDFERYFVKHYGACGKDYMIIDSDSLMHLFCEFDKKPRNLFNMLHRQFKGADYKLYDLSIGRYLRDLPELAPFKNTIVIIKKENLPYIFSTVLDNRPTVSLEDESDKDSGDAVVRMTVNPNWALRYSSETKVVRVMLTHNR